MLDTFTGASPEALEAIRDEMRIRKTTEVFLLFMMGSQYDHLIVQRLAKLGVYCLPADPASVTAADVVLLNPKGIIISGGPASVHSDPPPFDSAIFNLGIPILGICLGFQMWAKHLGATVAPAKSSEFYEHTINILSDRELLAGIGGEAKVTTVLQSHTDEVMPYHMLDVLAMSGNTIAAAGYWHLCGVQFHPEVTETVEGVKIFENFCFGICKAKDRFPATDVAAKKIAELRKQIGTKKVLIGLSGGSDSSTVAYLIKEALYGEPGRVRGIYIKGIDRPDDEAFVIRYFGSQPWIELVIVDSTDEYLAALAGKVGPKEKRMAMRDAYKDKFEWHIADMGGKDAVVVVQGTLYTDISESGGGAGGGYVSGAEKAVKKVHHNVNLKFSAPELIPLEDCVKDSARNIGREIGVPEELLVRHPFPGAGLVVRGEGEITPELLAMLRQLDDIWISELRAADLYHTVWQAGVNVTKSEHTFSKGDGGGLGREVMLWAVWSVNGFTARAAELPWKFLQKVTQRIGNEVKGVGAVTYRISNKPFSMIEQF